MKKNILSFIVVVAIIFSACAQQKKTTKSSVVKTKSANSAIQFIAMERTACFGTCPAYRLEIYKDGLVKYDGWSSVEYDGLYQKQFDPVKVAALYKEFEQYPVDTCAEMYESLIQDLPGINFYFTYKGREQKIINAHFGPGYLMQLANEADSFSKVDNTWTKLEEPKKD